MGKKPTYKELESYIEKLENKVYRALRTELINKTLFEIANALNQTDSLQDLYRSIHQILAKLIDMTNFYIAIYYREKNAIRIVYHVDRHDKSLDDVQWVENFTENRSLTGDVIMTRKPLFLKEEELKRLDRQGRIKGLSPRIWLGVPLMIDGDVMGVMAVQSYTNPDQFSEADVDVMSFVSDQVALSIQKKRAQEQLRKTQDRLIRSEKIEAIGTLAGGIAHDFNNTLSVTLGNINLAQMMVSDKELLQILDDAETSVMQAKELASRFIVFSKGGVILKEKTDTRSYINQTVSGICQEYQIPYSIDIKNVPSFMEISPLQLKEALKNIILNAWEAMEKKDRVDISSRMHPSKPDFFMISIKDTGCGIEKEKIERIFEPYYSTKDFGKDKGTGLGMSIAYSIIKGHGGDIRITSSPAKGTQVDVILTAPGKKESRISLLQTGEDRLQTDQPENRQPDLEKENRPVKVLIMDDDAMVRDMSSKILKRLGYDPVQAVNGEQAVQEYKNHFGGPSPIRFVLLDLEVKQGMGGAETIKELHDIDPGVTAIVASGYSSDRIMENCRDYGFEMAIAKPFSMKTLESALEKLSETIVS